MSPPRIGCPRNHRPVCVCVVGWGWNGRREQFSKYKSEQRKGVGPRREKESDQASRLYFSHSCVTALVPASLSTLWLSWSAVGIASGGSFSFCHLYKDYHGSISHTVSTELKSIFCSALLCSSISILQTCSLHQQIDQDVKEQPQANNQIHGPVSFS